LEKDELLVEVGLAVKGVEDGWSMDSATDGAAEGCVDNVGNGDGATVGEKVGLVSLLLRTLKYNMPQPTQNVAATKSWAMFEAINRA
jgi:hypothetical protein